MRTTRSRHLPVGLESTRRRFDRWREARTGRSRIPEVLWASAVKAAVRYGLNPTSRALRLDYYALKKRVSSAAAGGGHEGEGVATFVELPAPVSMGSCECIVELEDPRGAKMRVHLKGMPAPDLMALSRGFWSVDVRHGESRQRRT